jgi:catechol 2,3-dioxygenase-like lactoylglutathione lyase family enzyme
MTSPPPVAGVLETALYVEDLDAAKRFYAKTMGLPVLAGDHRFCALDAGRSSILLLFVRGSSQETMTLPGGTIPPHDGSGPAHFAFAIAAAELPGWEAHLAANGIAIEGRTRWPRGGESIYFRDPDEHLVELATPGIWATY